MTSVQVWQAAPRNCVAVLGACLTFVHGCYGFDNSAPGGGAVAAQRASQAQDASGSSKADAGPPADPNPYVSHVLVFQGETDGLGGKLAETALHPYLPVTVEVKLYVTDCTKGWKLKSLVLHNKDGPIVHTLEPDPQNKQGRPICSGVPGNESHSLYVKLPLNDPNPIFPPSQVSGVFSANSHADRPFVSNVPTLTRTINAISLAATATDVLWAGTTDHGLLGVRQGSNGTDAVVYKGQLSWGSAALLLPTKSTWPKTAAAFGPPTSTVTRLAADGTGGLFVGSAAGGLGHFHPGAKPFDKADDQWRWWGAPPALGIQRKDTMEQLYATGIRNSVLSVLSDGQQAAWVGTPTALWRVVLTDGAELPTWTEVTAGSTLALARSDPDTVWAGMVALDLKQPVAAPPGILLRLHRTGSSDNWQSTWYTAAQLGLQPGVVSDLDILSLYAQGSVLWIGTNAGLLGATLTANGVAAGGGSSLRWKEGPNGLVDGDVLAIAPAGPNSLWLGAFDHCEQDGGALILLDTGEQPLDGKGDSLVSWTAKDGLKDADVAAIVPLGPSRVAFATFNWAFGAQLNTTIGLGKKRRDAGCKPPPPGKDGVTILDTAGTPSVKADDSIFDF